MPLILPPEFSLTTTTYFYTKQPFVLMATSSYMISGTTHTVATCSFDTVGTVKQEVKSAVFRDKLVHQQKRLQNKYFFGWNRFVSYNNEYTYTYNENQRDEYRASGTTFPYPNRVNSPYIQQYYDYRHNQEYSNLISGTYSTSKGTNSMHFGYNAPLVFTDFSNTVNDAVYYGYTSSGMLQQFSIPYFGAGRFQNGYWNNGVWNSGPREDENIILINNIIAAKVNETTWTINLAGYSFAATMSGTQSYTLIDNQYTTTDGVLCNNQLFDLNIGNKISIGNIIGADINGARRLLKNDFIINSTVNPDYSIDVTLITPIPLTTISIDSPEHPIYITTNIWNNGSFNNGIFRGVWKNGSFNGHPRTCWMLESEWIDGVYNSGYFKSRHIANQFSAINPSIATQSIIITGDTEVNVGINPANSSGFGPTYSLTGSFVSFSSYLEYQDRYTSNQDFFTTIHPNIAIQYSKNMYLNLPLSSPTIKTGLIQSMSYTDGLIEYLNIDPNASYNSVIQPGYDLWSIEYRSYLDVTTYIKADAVSAFISEYDVFSFIENVTYYTFPNNQPNHNGNPSTHDIISAEATFTSLKFDETLKLEFSYVPVQNTNIINNPKFNYKDLYNIDTLQKTYVGDTNALIGATSGKLNSTDGWQLFNNNNGYTDVTFTNMLPGRPSLFVEPYKNTNAMVISSGNTSSNEYSAVLLTKDYSTLQSGRYYNLNIDFDVAFFSNDPFYLNISNELTLIKNIESGSSVASTYLSSSFQFSGYFYNITAFNFNMSYITVSFTEFDLYEVYSIPFPYLYTENLSSQDSKYGFVDGLKQNQKRHPYSIPETPIFGTNIPSPISPTIILSNNAPVE